MLVRVTTDNHIHGREALAREVEQSVESKLRRFVPQLTRVEVHLASGRGRVGTPPPMDR